MTSGLPAQMKKLGISTGMESGSEASPSVNSEGQLQVTSSVPPELAALASPMAAPGQRFNDPQLRLCSINGCNSKAFASGLCALHLPTQNDSGTTPTTLTRINWKLWEKTQKQAGKEQHIKWKFVYKGDAHEVTLVHKQREETFTISVDGGEPFTSDPQTQIQGFSHFFALPGKSPTRCKVSSYTSYMELVYDLAIDGMPFEKAKQMFQTKIAQKQAQQLLAKGGGGISTTAKTPSGHGLHEADFSSAGKKAEEGKARSRVPAHIQHASYTKENVRKEGTTAKTKKGFGKNIITWNFTVEGVKQEVVFAHSSLSNKRKVLLNNEVVTEDKPGPMGPSWAKYRFPLGHAEDAKHFCTVLMHSEAKQKGVGGSRYDLLIDEIPFDQATLTVFDIAKAGGVARAVAKRTHKLDKEDEE